MVFVGLAELAFLLRGEVDPGHGLGQRRETVQLGQVLRSRRF